MKKEKGRAIVFKDAVLKILYEHQKGTRRPKQMKNSFTSAIAEIEMMPQAPDQNWTPVNKKTGKPDSGSIVYLTVQQNVIKGFYDKSAKCFKDVYGNVLEDVRAWYREPKAYQLFGKDEA